jgi:tetratricopeptide (TPR) repeat protein/predicted O-methyltransferase YrrM
VDSNYLIQAIAQCERAIAQKLDLESWQAACRNLGNLLQGMGRFDRAIVWHSWALEQQPNLVEVYAQLGELYILEENWSGAIELYRQALKYAPNSVQIYSNLAQLYGQLGQREQEMESWYKAAELNPSLVNPQGYYKLGKAFESKGKIAEAIVCYQRASSGAGGLVAANYDLGEIWLRQGQLEAAKSCYEKILAVEPNEARAQYKLGTIYLETKRFEEAIDRFRQTIKIAPEFPWAYRDLVKTFLLLQRWDEAIATCYAIINLVEAYPWVYVQLGNALREKGRIAEAAANFQKACSARGWQECSDKNYFFTQDIFSYRIPIWETYLQPRIESRARVRSSVATVRHSAAIAALEVGCYQGMSACWLLDKILTHPESKLTCLEETFDRKLTENIAKTQVDFKVTCLSQDVSQSLAALESNSFDLINLQDKHKLSDRAERNTSLAWKLLKVGGLIVFNDYGWTNPAYPEQNPQLGIDRFLNSIAGQWELVHQVAQAYQFIVCKKS